MIMSKEEFYKWYLSFDWIYRSDVCEKIGGGLNEYTLDKSIRTE